MHRGAAPAGQANAAKATAELLERVVGEKGGGCPWSAFYDFDVAAVMSAAAWYEKGQAREWWGDDPEWWLVEGVGIYRAALDRTRADVFATLRKKG